MAGRVNPPLGRDRSGRTSHTAPPPQPPRRGPAARAGQLATGGLRPELTLLLDLPVEEGQRRRRAARGAGGDWNRLDAETRDFHERVRAAYLALAQAEPERWVVLDATLAPATLAEGVWEAVSARLRAG